MKQSVIEGTGKKIECSTGLDNLALLRRKLGVAHKE